VPAAKKVSLQDQDWEKMSDRLDSMAGPLLVVMAFTLPS